jgi:hypothetical protein
MVICLAIDSALKSMMDDLRLGGGVCEALASTFPPFHTHCALVLKAIPSVKDELLSVINWFS